MLVALLCFDKPGHVDLRLKLRPTHLEWIEKTGVKMVYAGPMLNDEGGTARTGPSSSANSRAWRTPKPSAKTILMPKAACSRR